MKTKMSSANKLLEKLSFFLDVFGLIDLPVNFDLFPLLANLYCL